MASDYVLGVDSSTQSTKALLVDAATGEVVAQQSAPHPDGTSVDPRAWLDAFDQATAGLLDRASAVAVGGQQHGMVALDESDSPVHDAILWNDTRSSGEARDLIDEMGGPDACADTIGSVLVASFTSTKLRWLRDHEPDAAARTRRVLLPHDYVSRHIAGGEPFTDRGDASGTGYFSTGKDDWLPELAEAAIGHTVELPRIVASSEVAAKTANGLVVGAGTGDNMAAALALDLGPGDIVVSIGTSGVASAISPSRIADGTGSVTGFADATGRFLPMATTINAARILDLQATLLGVDHEELGRLAARRSPGRQRADDRSVLRRRTYAQPARRHRHLERADLVDDPRGPRPRRVRGPALLARRRRRPPRRQDRDHPRPHPHGRRRSRQSRGARHRAGDLRQPRDRARPRRVRRPRRRPSGRLGARRLL